MINLILGKKGSGKTKKLIEQASEVVAQSNGNVIMIVKGSNLTFDLNHKVRLINIDDYKICSFCGLYGFVCGLCAGNYDLTNILIDSILDICGTNVADFNDFIKKLNLLTEKCGIKLTLSTSLSSSDLTPEVNLIVNYKSGI